MQMVCVKEDIVCEKYVKKYLTPTWTSNSLTKTTPLNMAASHPECSTLELTDTTLDYSCFLLDLSKPSFADNTDLGNVGDLGVTMMLVILLLSVSLTAVFPFSSSCVLGRHRFRRGGPSHVPDRQDDRPHAAHSHAHALPARAHIW